MAYVRVADPLLDESKSARSTDIKRIRDNQDYFNGEIDDLVSLSLISSNAINDDFLADTSLPILAIGPWWDRLAAAGDSCDIVSEHQLRCLTNGIAITDYAGVTGNADYQRIVKTEEYVAVCEVRVKIVGELHNNYFFGWNDEGLTVGDNFADTSNCVGVDLSFVTGWVGITSKSGAAVATSIFGTVTNWNIVRLIFTCSATARNRKVLVYLNGSLVGTLDDDAFMPDVTLRPAMGCRGNTVGAANREIRFDYALFYTTTHPRAA